MNVTELKPCPFCGGQPDIVNGNTIYDVMGWHTEKYIECQKCYMRSPAVNENEDNDTIIELWNERNSAEWTNVNEQLPKENGEYWCFYKTRLGQNRVSVFHFCAKYNAAWDINGFNVGKFTIFDGDSYVPVKVNVTHWIPYEIPKWPEDTNERAD